MNIDKFDRIILSQTDVDYLFDWKDMDRDRVRNFNPVLERGVILVEDYHKQIFIKSGDNYIFTILNPKTNESRHVFSWNRVTNIGHVIHSELDERTMPIEEYNKSILATYTSLMAYMEYYSNNKDYVDVQERSIAVPKKVNKHSKKKKSATRIRRKLYKVNVPKEVMFTCKREYERHVEKWTVRGHWRQTKNGKVWIKPYLKGNGKEITPKEYKL